MMKRILMIVLTAVLLPACFALPASAAEEQAFCQVEPGCYRIKNVNSGLYLSVESDVDALQQSVILSDLNEEASGQKFMIFEGSDGCYIRPETSIKSGRVLNAAADKMKSGVLADIYDCYDDSTMMWKFTVADDAYLIHVSANTKYFLTYNKSKQAYITNNTENPNIHWQFERVEGTPAIVSYPVFNSYGTYTAEVNAKIFNPQNGAISKYGVTLYDSNGKIIKSYGKSTDTDAAHIDIKFDLQKVLKLILEPDTNYKYAFYAVIDGEKYKSAKKSFITDKEYRKVLAHGIDVSSWQGSVDWKKVAASGIDFAILRTGFTSGVDNRFEEYYEQARKAGLDLGCYFYTYATSVEESVKDAKKVLKQLEGKRFEYPIYIDIEDSNQLKINERQRTEICVAFMNTLEDAGYYTGTYSSLYWYNHMLDKEQIAENGEIWLAHWTEHTNATDTYFGLWQYTSKGGVDGISGNVDMDVAFVDYPSIIKAAGRNGYIVTPIPGDADGNGTVSMQDITLLQKMIAKMRDMPLKNSEQYIRCDADGNGKIDMNDVIYVQLMIAGLK